MGADSLIGFTASLILSSTETVFYTMSVYFMYVGMMSDFAGLGFELRLFVRVDAVEKEIEGHLRLQQFAFAQRADVSPGGRRNHNGVAPPLTGFFKRRVKPLDTPFFTDQG